MISKGAALHKSRLPSATKPATVKESPVGGFNSRTTKKMVQSYQVACLVHKTFKIYLKHKHTYIISETTIQKGKYFNGFPAPARLPFTIALLFLVLCQTRTPSFSYTSLIPPKKLLPPQGFWNALPNTLLIQPSNSAEFDLVELACERTISDISTL